MEQKKGYQDLTIGPITDTLIKLTMPILGTSLLMMLHNFVDMWCVSRLGSREVAAAGTGGFYIWLAMSTSAVSRIGSQVKLSHSVGKKEFEDAKSYVESGIIITLMLGFLLGLIILTKNKAIVSFFRYQDTKVVFLSEQYLKIIAYAMPFFFLNPVLSAIFQGAGNSRLPFHINLIGLVLNILLNFTLIFGMGLGVFGAALSTSLAQIIMSILYVVEMKKSNQSFLKPTFRNGISFSKMKEIVLIGLPYGIQETAFTVISIMIGRLVAVFGNSQIAAQKVGSQLEAISWESASGFSAALTAFVGQNYSSNKRERILKGYHTTICFSAMIGFFAFFLFFFFGKEVFSIFFVGDAETLDAGAVYLKILSLSQVLMCLEITTAGLFNGIGKTVIPSTIGIVFTGLRIPFAYVLSQPQYLGVEGIWWVISMSSVIKGMVALSAYWYYKTYRKEAFSLQK